MTAKEIEILNNKLKYLEVLISAANQRGDIEESTRLENEQEAIRQLLNNS
ncbi:MAG: hypothetical protein IM591_12320 [Chitinophagaceae bacterium]|jgi:hypothetical protein|nr:hypothetical protein [Microcystis sp. M061S2]MCA2656097.1 hypothetical protein [Microcystis sp. M061S2]MCA6471163.1 hypothetical protein [Chitinophagaceae bacterium]